MFSFDPRCHATEVRLRSAGFIGASVVAVSVAATVLPIGGHGAHRQSREWPGALHSACQRVCDLGAIRGKARLSNMAGVLSYFPGVVVSSIV